MKKSPKISVITASLNSSSTIEKTIISVINQDIKDVEHIIKDGMSSDDTLQICKKFPKLKVIQKPDSGIYDAMNQGFAYSTGDIICFLNSDDFFADSSVLKEVSEMFKKYDVDFVYGNIDMINSKMKTIRTWRLGGNVDFDIENAQIPHPAFFVKKNSLMMIGSTPFDSSLEIAADLKQQILLIKKHKRKGIHINKSLTKMMIGGKSTSNLKNIFLGWKESVNVWNEVHGGGGIGYLYKKICFKIKGFIYALSIK